MGPSLTGLQSSQNDCMDVVGRHLGGCVLPEAKDRPAKGFQALRGINIPLGIALSLEVPIFRVRARSAVVGRASMPEAPINEHGHLAPGEGDISASAAVEWQRPIHLIAQSPAVQFPTNREFRLGVPAPIRPHGGTRRRSRSP